ncbi:hypothetical protein RA086_05535 [Lactiplantibacillus sp. WILCCON 0030]|uniref:Uncharacterized protein n=1 Tax=Lactiplantibacillus brownii TaxID=3069269 RepID=A0ABU1A817_9LACO|nr:MULTISPECIES: hypothetical protein [Lactiplantibacillus]MDQ7937088.1 hypothetical protein [Lactiplantibacillus brownii]
MTTSKLSAQIVVSENIDRVNNPNGLGDTVRLVNPTLTLGMPIVPTALSFSISVLTDGLSFDTDHHIKLAIEDESNNEISKVEGDVKSFAAPHMGGFNINFDFRNVVFQKSGRYTAIFSIDGDPVQSQKFRTFSDKNEATVNRVD